MPKDARMKMSIQPEGATVYADLREERKERGAPSRFYQTTPAPSPSTSAVVPIDSGSVSISLYVPSSSAFSTTSVPLASALPNQTGTKACVIL